MTITDHLALGVVVAIQVGSLVMVFMMITRRGWWKDPDIGYDWSTTDDCRFCWEYGPMYPQDERARDVHQAQHAIVAVVLHPVFWLIGKISGPQTQHPH